MPIFQDPERESRPYFLWGSPADCTDGPSTGTPDKAMDAAGSVEDDSMRDMRSSQQESETESAPRFQTSNRQELIRSIKRGESPTWIPSPSEQLGKYFETHGDPPHLRVEGELREDEESSPTAAGVNQTPEREINPTPSGGSAADIQRPRSALHSGDFREGSPDPDHRPPPIKIPSVGHRHFNLSPPAHWYNLEGPRNSSSRGNDHFLRNSRTRSNTTRSRAPSLGSFSSSYVLKAPTSPLVFQANNPDLDFSPKISERGTATSKGNRRRTLPPETFQSLQTSPRSSFTPSRLQRREGTFPFTSHQSRKSITSPYTLQLASSPQSPDLPRRRRQSFSTDGTPLHHGSHAPMVGSYEESILRGRMSTTPSKPLDFTAQIGVLGRGNCKPHLKCPSHVTVPFPAVFYSYSTSGIRRSISDDSPSPYVGYIDLENSLPPETRSVQRSMKRRHTSPVEFAYSRYEGQDIYAESPSHKQERRAREKRSRRSHFPQSPPGGCYRIPQQGQIQIIIKNPNKTAVKLFLVPYDLEDMEPGTKTFMRQRSYSVGSIIDTPGTSPPPDVTANPPQDANDKPILRYLVHLNICCTAKGRFYLHSGIRVVFANRVPDGKERLRNEIQYPDPRYTPYRPTKEGITGSKTTADRHFRRQSYGLDHSTGPRSSQPFYSARQDGQDGIAARPIMPELPRAVLFPGPSLPNIDNISPVNDWLDPYTGSTDMPFAPFLTAQQRPQHDGTSSRLDGEFFDAIGADDSGKKRRALESIVHRSGEAGESLLSRKLRDLDVLKREAESQKTEERHSLDECQGYKLR